MRDGHIQQSGHKNLVVSTTSPCTIYVQGTASGPGARFGERDGGRVGEMDIIGPLLYNNKATDTLGLVSNGKWW